MEKYKQSPKVLALISFIAIILLSGCVGSGLRSIMTEEKKYKNLIMEISKVPQGYGRILIYSPKGGPDFLLNTMGDIDFFSIDKKIYRFGGETYFYLDVEVGSHLVTVTDVLVRGFASNKKQQGKRKLKINLANGQTIFLRFVNRSVSKSIKDRNYDVNVIEKNQAERELDNLDYWNNHETTMKLE
jgi:hypothetical protein